MKVTYGIDVQEKDDPYIKQAEAALHSLLQATTPGIFLVDTFPILKHVPKWFPGASFRRKAEQWRKGARAMVDLPFAAAKTQIVREFL
jgi:hypothetical protein